MKFYINLLLCFVGMNMVNAQVFGLDLGVSSSNEIKQNEFLDEDIVPIDTIYLKDSEFYSVQLKTDLEKKYYYWLRKRVHDVWPYVRTAVREYNEVMDTVSTMDKRRDQKRYIKQRQRALAEQFESQLKNMTVSRGQILTKLIHKETNKTTYDIIKELRGGVSAFLYNTAGGAYNINLKETFDPKRTREDLYIIVIIQRDIASGILKPIYDDNE
ncbi:DUF4294 domain-containing protein [Faecalibacter sp. LW9]|uniref:DUF4294 domain-containing protein n=1 Tax=Faecalibacter sp. LW9 TaxID=3103144 RepID=UPI002AFEEF9E|nr:DUF4294 domain-containing protein [Faecalibacter sp. LW9]